jgi:hypothetical protein
MCRDAQLRVSTALWNVVYFHYYRSFLPAIPIVVVGFQQHQLFLSEKYFNRYACKIEM